MLARLLEMIEKTVPAQRVVLLGFSQGACLTLEFSVRNARRYGGIVGLSGGLIGPDGTPRDHPGSFHPTPALLCCTAADPHIRRYRGEEAAAGVQGKGTPVT